MVTYILSRDQSIGKILSNQLLGATAESACDDLNALLCKKLYGPLPHATGNDHSHAKLVKPSGEYTRFMGWRLQDFFLFYVLVFHVYDGKFRCMAKMGSQPSLSRPPLVTSFFAGT